MKEPKRAYVNLQPGDPAPWFTQRSASNPRYAFDTAAGRYIVLCFFASAADAQARAALEAVAARRALFDDTRACFFGVSVDPKDESEQRVADSMPGLRLFWDFDGAIGRIYGALPNDARPDEGNVPMRRFWVVLDPTMRVLQVVPFAPDGSDREKLLDYVEALPPPARFSGVEIQAPVLYLPNVFEPELCVRLIALYEADGGKESGFMREVEGQTVMLIDHAHKRRRDCEITDQSLITLLQRRVRKRINPEIEKAFCFTPTRMERYIVACYSQEDGGHFRQHRDNTTKGTAHRRFAVTINLNGDFEGGELSFPEYGPRSFKPPPGGAVVFSCSLLHAASPVTRGRRFAFLPFLYDDAAAKIREQNNEFLGDGVGRYKA